MAARRGKAPTRAVTQDELNEVALEVLRTTAVLGRTQVKKFLPPEYQPHSAAVLEALRRLAADGRLERWQKGASEWFFAENPVATLGRLSRAALALGPLSPEALQKRLELETRLPKAYLQEWKKGALARGELFEVTAPSPPAGSKRRTKLLSLEPDLRGALKRALGELEKSLAALEARGVSRERVARFLFDELGLTKHLPSSFREAAPSSSAPASAPGSLQEERPVFLHALRALTRERRAGALLQVSDLRERTPLDKARFDRIALELAREGLVDLHYHDHPQSLAAADRERLVRDDAGTHYVGIALRPTA